jgi:signal transduction histidine kinase
VDYQGSLWVGTGAGLNRLRTSNLSTFGQTEGLGYGPVQGLAEVAPGAILAGKPNDGLYRWEGKTFKRVATANASRLDIEVNTLLMSQAGACWVGTAHGLFRCSEPRAPDLSTNSSSLQGLNIISLAEDSRGTWAGTHEGELWREEGGKWLLQTNLVQSHPVTAIVPEPDGSVWVGTEGGGLHRLKADGRSHLDKHDGLLSDFVRTLYLDRQGALWIGTAGGGLSRWQVGVLNTFTTREGLPDNIISQILEDDEGRLWLGSNRGVACVDKMELDQVAAGKARKAHPVVYGRAEGMPSEECSSGFFPAGLKTKSGLLWFSTLKGIVVADPRPQSVYAYPPVAMLEEVLVDGVGATVETKEKTARQSRTSSSRTTGAENQSLMTYPADSVIRIAPGKHRLEFHYTALNFSAPDRIRFRYRLEGLDSDWLEADTQRVAYYGYVPPRDYHFSVTACNSDGVWNDIPASISLKVLPQFWQTWWFIGLATVVLLFTVGGAVRLIEKSKHQHRLANLEQERALERERARIAQDLHDDLGSSLTRISLLSDLARADKEHPAQVEVHAAKISQSAGQTVRALEEIVWALRPGSDSLQSLVEYIAHFANELFDGDSAHCRLDFPPDLPPLPLLPEMRHNIFLVVKEALTNALKHAGAREVRVQTKATSKSLEILVQDDGRGFSLPGSNGHDKRHGLGNMRRRAEAMRGTLEIESAPGKGTAIRLNVKFPTSYQPGDF